MEDYLRKKLDTIERYVLLSGKNVLTFEDAQLLTGLSGSCLYKKTSSHTIPFYRPSGKQIFFDRCELESWMKQNRVSTTTEIEQQANSYVATVKKC